MAATDGLRRLYRDTVLDHSSHPRNFGRLENPDREATGHNPLCGDKISLSLRITLDGRIDAVAFEASGCAISMASASMLTDLVRGLSHGEAQDMIRSIEDTFHGRPGSLAPGDMAALAGVRDYPSRIRCATLAWRTLDAALRQHPDAVSTENEA